MPDRNSPFGRLPKAQPKTGDGKTGGQKPRMADTNLGKGQTAGKSSRLRLPRFLGGKHRRD